MSNRINVTRREFQDSYRRHFKMYKETAGNDKTRRLILFYSVECGLKSLLMKDLGKDTYEEFSEWLGCDELDLTAFDLEDMNFRLKKVPRIYRDIYELGLEPTKQSIDLLNRRYLE